MTATPPKLLDRLRHACRVRHYSVRTEDAYHNWCRRFILFHDKRHPREMGEPEVNAFLTHLAVDGHVAASTQNQALAALLFLYEHVLARPLDRLGGVVRASRPARLPVVLSRAEVQRVLAHLTATPRLMAVLMYGGGLRVMECLRLRVQDVDFDRHELLVRHGKGGKDRRTVLPESAAGLLRSHLERVRLLFADDRAAGVSGVYLPDALDRKYPGAGGSGAGSGCSRRPSCRRTREAASGDGTTPTRVR